MGWAAFGLTGCFCVHACMIAHICGGRWPNNGAWKGSLPKCSLHLFPDVLRCYSLETQLLLSLGVIGSCSDRNPWLSSVTISSEYGLKQMHSRCCCLDEQARAVWAFVNAHLYHVLTLDISGPSDLVKVA